MTRPRRPLPLRSYSSTVQGPGGDPAILIESLEVRPGQKICLTFESADPSWRQGLFLGTAGLSSVAGATSPQLNLWTDSAPPEVLIYVLETDGSLVLYNIWDSGRGRRSQSHTSGMILEHLADNGRRYWCTDFGSTPDFGKLVFRISFDDR